MATSYKVVFYVQRVTRTEGTLYANSCAWVRHRCLKMWGIILMKKVSLLSVALFSLVVASSSQAQQYRVDYSFNSGLGATSTQNFGDPLVARAYPSVGSNPTLSVAGGNLTLGTQASSFDFGIGKIAGVRPLFGGIGDPSRDLYVNAMKAEFLPFVEAMLNASSMQLETSQFWLWGNGAPANFGIRVQKNGDWRVFSAGAIVEGTSNTNIDRLRMQINGSGLMEFLINGTIVHTSTAMYASLSNPVSGSLTMEIRTAGVETFDAVTIDRFSFGSDFNVNVVPEPSTTLLFLVGLGGLFILRRRRLT